MGFPSVTYLKDSKGNKVLCIWENPDKTISVKIDPQAWETHLEILGVIQHPINTVIVLMAYKETP